MKELTELRFDDKGLIPAIIQEEETKEILMMAYMNDASLKKTLETGETWFWSRSRGELWHKGGTSGHIQKVREISYDCDGDTLLVKVTQEGAACHTGEKSCFYNPIYREDREEAVNGEILQKLYDVIADRKANPKEGSYTNYLFDKGIDKILKKVGEETAEVIIAAKNTDKNELVYEAGDLLYHLLVLLKEKDIAPEEIFKELKKRAK
ncbi:phosphoribosyl-ATP pyrophosphatase /phosphoribosyl-AMP cyclohydrolase [Natronincola peptidivorans]|uniref:Histidine biosynthesis bifunctional protein HisIE n=1 Tax=Natronincola peptidivorans TaxID=426128 RepID=A0A1H9ZKU7_9FIRM|nr:bifunctional phosphoribosyl-AMP cyclohydrolase/phosphoribosyl-ATP diphosphatase HisIE [Natronincola peptidivorans]SES81964.1 phosphoribosyl-ATP pyrophosphatase /phosphoribosyl-AMP cyclohydrolase [Natronincola peptidivorans]